MRYSLKILLIFFIITTCNVISSADQTGEQEINITVYGMRCVGCELGIEREIAKLKGVISVKADSSKNIVTVKYKKNLIKIDTIIDKITELGYRAEKPFK